MSYVPLLNFEKDYEILNRYPFTIRRRFDKYKITDCEHNLGYVRVWLNGDYYLKHVLIAKQFIPNDDPKNKTEVDHKNRNRSDYRLANLRWVTPSENNYNRKMPEHY